MVKLHVLVLPAESVAVLETVVTPTGKAKPLAGLLSTLADPQLSVAVTLNTTLLVQALGAASKVMFAGQLIVGGSASTTVTVKVQVLVPQRFEAVAVTVVAPTGNWPPGGMGE